VNKNNDKLVQPGRYRSVPNLSTGWGVNNVHRNNENKEDNTTDHKWTVEETFDLGETGDYPAHDPFLTKRTTGASLSSTTTTLRSLTSRQWKERAQQLWEGKQWSASFLGGGDDDDDDERQSSQERFPSLIRRAQQLWEELLAMSSDTQTNRRTMIWHSPRLSSQT